MAIFPLLGNALKNGIKSCVIMSNYVQLFSYALFRITITNSTNLLLKQQWFLSKKMLKLIGNKSVLVYVPNVMGLIEIS